MQDASQILQPGRTGLRPPAQRRRRLPFLVLLAAISGVAMFVPAAVAANLDEHELGRVFFYTGLLSLIVTLFAWIATQTLRPAQRAATHLIGLLIAYLTLPALLALPLYQAIGNTQFFNVYMEMLSSLTTTGASFFEPSRLTEPMHLWRGMVAWLGGFLVWVTAIAVLAPMNLGGFEVTSEARLSDDGATSQIQAVRPQERMRRVAVKFAPIYLGLTVLIWIGLLLSGMLPLNAALHAMATLSTSGILGQDGLASGFASEAVIFVFFALAMTRRTYVTAQGEGLWDRLSRDRELWLALVVIVVLSALLFLRHWLAALDLTEPRSPEEALAAIWGAVFTIASFLTTTGFISDEWEAARAWSGLPTPGLLLMGLCMMGGGVATTAGGVKLMRVYALYKHGKREIEKLVHPNSVASAGRLGRRIRREGAYIAWIFFMLFALSLAACMTALALTGLDFESAMVLSVAALTTTGPLAEIAGTEVTRYVLLSDPAKLILAVAMVVGRLETLVLIALLNPGFWRA
ncbi:MAG: potassium transporter TrkG [Pseudomonadota bacterium]